MGPCECVYFWLRVAIIAALNSYWWLLNWTDSERSRRR